MSTLPRATSPQWAYIDGELRKRGLTTGDLVRGSGVHRSRLTGLRNGGLPSVPTARAYAAFLGVSMLDMLVGLRVLTAQEAAQRPAEMVDLSAVTEHELIEHVRERLRRRLWLLSFAPHLLPYAMAGGKAGASSVVADGDLAGEIGQILAGENAASLDSQE